LLLEELGLSDFNIEDEIYNIVNLSEAKESNRVDAEYFQEKYDKLIEKIKKHKAKKLSDLVSIKKGIEPGSEEYQDDGKPFIRVSNISKFGINNNNQKYLTDEFYQKLKNDFEPQMDEILLTKDATPGIAWAVKENTEGIIAGGILRLKIKSEIEPEYLTLALNSVIGQMQTERDTGGSIIIHWRPEQIKNCLIPILPKSTQQKIADLIRASHQARKEAKELLQKAKRKVEEEIEK
jgi:restriction endonuclease S subunit